jgi:hypothetical protein
MLDLLVTRRGNPSDAESGEFTPSARDLSPQMGGLSNREALSPRENRGSVFRKAERAEVATQPSLRDCRA